MQQGRLTLLFHSQALLQQPALSHPHEPPVRHQGVLCSVHLTQHTALLRGSLASRPPAGLLLSPMGVAMLQCISMTAMRSSLPMQTQLAGDLQVSAAGEG